MITVNMHDAKTRLSELVRAVEERNETVVLCRDGKDVAEIRRRVERSGAARSHGGSALRGGVRRR